MLWKSEGQPQFQESLTQLASLPSCGLAAEVWAMAKLNVNQNKFEYLWKLPEVDVESGDVEGRAGEQLSKVNSLSAQSLWIEKLKIMNDTHTRTNRSILLAQIQFSTELLTHPSYLPPLPPRHQRFPSSLFAFTEVSKWKNNNASSRCWQTLFPCLSQCVSVCMSMCLRVSMWLTHLEACRQRQERPQRTGI